ncbi:MAG: MMPL family transporter [Bacteroidia bacterium]
MIFPKEQLQKLDSLEYFLLNEYGAKSHYSLLTQVKRLHRAFHAARPSQFRIPGDSAELDGIIGFLKANKEVVELDGLVQNQGTRILVRAQISDLGKPCHPTKRQGTQRFLSEQFPENQGFSYHITGPSALLDQSNERIARQLGWGLLGAMMLIAVWMGLWFSSWKMAGISLLVNVLPLMAVAGLLGWLGIGIKLSTAVIFTIAFGIAVDDTIHFLSRYRAELKKGNNKALARSFVSTGRAIALTSLVLVAGFGMLLFSSFEANRITGLFISLALLIAVAADLLLLPVLLSIFPAPFTAGDLNTEDYQ